MNPQLLTIVVAGFTLTGILAYDVWAFVNAAKGDTVSNVMAAFGHHLPVLPFWWGVAGGHLFAVAPPMLDAGGRLALLLWMSIVIMLLCQAQVLDITRRWDVVGVLVLGTLTGALLLSQRHSYELLWQ